MHFYLESVFVYLYRGVLNDLQEEHRALCPHRLGETHTLTQNLYSIHTCTFKSEHICFGVCTLCESKNSTDSQDASVEREVFGHFDLTENYVDE